MLAGKLSAARRERRRWGRIFSFTLVLTGSCFSSRFRDVPYTHTHTQQREGGGGGIETQEYQLALFLSKPFKHIHSSLAKPHDESPAFQNSWRHKNGGVAQLVAFMGCGTALRHVVPIWGEAASSLREA